MNARDYALLELDARRLPGWKPRAVRHRGDIAPPVDPRDRGLAENILIGVVKNLLLLQHLTQHYSGRSLKSIDPAVQKILAVGLYQIRLLTRIPPSAAVDEAVEQTRRFGQKRASGFVNAVLRKATREPDVPLPSAEQDPRRYAGVVLSHPPEVFDRLVALAGVEEALRICRHNQAEAPTTVRLFRDVTLARLQHDGVTLAPHEQPGMVFVEPAKVSVLAAWAEQGLAQAQDPTSAAVVGHCDVQPGQAVLDRCCGRGTKTLQLRDALGASGQVVAVDPALARIASLKTLVQQRGLSNVHVHQAAMLRDLKDVVPDRFDRVLIDAPCSNSGVLARRPEARYAQHAEALRSVAKLQTDILDDTAGHVTAGGLLVYSTCSIWPEENGGVVSAFRQRHPEYELASETSTLPRSDGGPTAYRDGGYVAVLRRR